MYENISVETIKDMVAQQQWMLLSVPFSEKDDIKTRGAWFSPDLKMWYSKDTADLLDYRMCRLTISFEQKDEAKKNGAQWNAVYKFWSFPEKDKHKFSKWASTHDIFGSFALRDKPVRLASPTNKTDVVAQEATPVFDSDDDDIMLGPMPYINRI